MTRWSARTASWRRAFRIWCARIRRRSGWARRRRTALAKVAHARPMLSLDNAFSDEEVRGVRRAGAALPGACRGRAGGDDRRAQDRRAVLLAALRARRAGAGGDARRRRGRRGRHRQRRGRSPTFRSASPARPTCSRCAAKSTCRRPISRRLNERQEASGRQDLRQSAQRRRRVAAPEGCRRSPPRGRCASSPTAGASCQRAAGRHAVRRDEADRGLRHSGRRPARRAATTLDDDARPLSRRSSRRAPTCRSTSTAWSTRSTGSTGRSGSASSRARRAGGSRTNSPPRRPRRRWKRSTSRSAAPAS